MSFGYSIDFICNQQHHSFGYSLGFSNFKYLIDATTTCSSCNNFALSVFTTCARWASTFQITSPHNYLNFEIVYSTVKFGAGNNVNRVNRFFKFITDIIIPSGQCSE